MGPGTMSQQQATPMSATRECEKVNILGVGVSAVNMLTVIDRIDDLITRRKRGYICITPVHGIMECRYSEDLRRIYNRAELVTPDGMPVVWLLRAHGHPEVERVYGPDLMLALCAHSLQREYRHFFYGGAEGVADELALRLTQRFAGLKVGGTISPPFRPLTREEDQAVVDEINGSHSDIVWVGLGNPKQEYWMAEHIGQITAPVLIGVGAAFDFHTGRKNQAPRWMQRSGMEWAFRLASEPRRLWKRYLVGNTLFLGHILLQASGLRKYPCIQ